MTQTWTLLSESSALNHLLLSCWRIAAGESKLQEEKKRLKSNKQSQIEKHEAVQQPGWQSQKNKDTAQFSHRYIDFFSEFWTQWLVISLLRAVGCFEF